MLDKVEWWRQAAAVLKTIEENELIDHDRLNEKLETLIPSRDARYNMLNLLLDEGCVAEVYTKGLTTLMITESGIATAGICMINLSKHDREAATELHKHLKPKKRPMPKVERKALILKAKLEEVTEILKECQRVAKKCRKSLPRS